MNVDNVRQDDWIVGGLALLLAIALLFFPWYHVSASFGPVSVSRDAAAASSPYAIWGVLALIATLALIADLALERLSPQTRLPAVSGSRTMTRLAIVGVTLFLLVIKFLAHIGDFGWGFFVIVVAFLALAYFTFMHHNAAAGGGLGSPPPRGTGATPQAPGAGTPGAGVPGTGPAPGGAPGGPATGGAPGGAPPPGAGAGGSTPPPPGP